MRMDLVVLETEVNKEKLHILQHALGLDEYGQGESYRNHFCAGGDDEPACRELVALGYMQQHPTTKMLPYYNCSVTQAGRDAVRQESPRPPKLTRGQQNYREWLRIADIYPDWTFGDWLKRRRGSY